MARTVNEIYEAIIAYKDNQLFLQDLTPQNDTAQQLASDLNSTSKVAIWRLWAYTMAVAIWMHETLWDFFKAEIDTKINDGVWGTLRWYQSQALKFQYGDLLIYNSTKSKYEYAVIDSTKQIVQRCAVSEHQNGFLIFKVAKLIGNAIMPLAQPEVAALSSYLDKIRFAGTPVQVVSGVGDSLRIALNISYDPIIPLSIVQNDVKQAIASYISNLPFNGEFRIIRLIDAIQLVEGVVDVSTSSVQTRLTSLVAWQPIISLHLPHFGYYKIENAAGSTLDDTINYFPV